MHGNRGTTSQGAEVAFFDERVRIRRAFASSVNVVVVSYGDTDAFTSL